MDIFLIAAEASDGCKGIGPIVSVIKNLFAIIQIVVPIALLIMGVLDLAKAVMSSDEKEIKGATSKFIKRAVAAVAVFFAYTIVNAIMGLLRSDSNDINTTDWATCWDNS